MFLSATVFTKRKTKNHPMKSSQYACSQQSRQSFMQYKQAAITKPPVSCAQAFMQYKAAAATHLTDWAFVKAQCPGPLPTSGVLRQFEELFRQHDLVLMGHSVDLSSTVASHVQGLFHSNAQYLVALCEVSEMPCRKGHTTMLMTAATIILTMVNRKGVEECVRLAS